MASDLPEGFVLDKPKVGTLPNGFIVNTTNPESNDTSGMSSSEYRAEILEPARQKAIESMPQEEIHNAAMGQFMITNPISKIQSLFRSESDEEKDFKAKSKELRRIKDIEDSEFKELYPEGTINELFSNTPEDASMKQRAGILLRNLAIQDDAERAKSLEKIGFKQKEVAGSYVVEDESGTEYVVNHPDFSQSDLISFGAGMAQSAPAGKYVSGARGGISVIKRALAAGLAEGLVQEGAQAALGGDFDKWDIAINAGFGLAGEGVGRYLGSKIKNLSPELKRKSAQSENIIEMMEVLNVDEKQLRKALAESATSIPEKNRIMAQVDQGLSLAKLKAAASADPSKAIEVEDAVDMATAGHIASLEHALNPSTRASRQVMEGVKNATDKIKKHRIGTRRAFTDAKYDEAFEGVGEIDVSGIKSRLQSISQLTNPNSPEGLKLDSFIRQLNPRDDGAVILDARGREVLDLEKDPQSIQDVIIGMRRVRDSKSTDPKVVREIKKALNEIVPFLNEKTGGKLAVADAAYSKVMDMNERLMRGHLGKGADLDDVTWGQFQNAVLDPKPQNKAFAKRYMEMLRADNPQAASDLWGSYWIGKLDSLPSKAKPSQLKKALFGGKNHPADMAPNPISARAIRDLEKLVNANEKIQDITLDKAAKKWAQGQLDPEVAHWVYIRMGISRALKGKKDRELANAWFGVANDPAWAKQLVSLIDSSPIRAKGKQVNAKKALEEANTFADKTRRLFEKWMADNNIGTGGIPYAIGQQAEEQRENQSRQE